MRIVPEWRDKFPKTNLIGGMYLCDDVIIILTRKENDLCLIFILFCISLLQGYIGDRSPICADLPPRAFLTKGAKYRFIGGSKVC